jgi:hypothetical protein
MFLAVTSRDAKNWRVLYRAAVAETDITRAPRRISEAEDAAIGRVRELFYLPGKIEEKEELKHAFRTLRALRGASEDFGVSEPMPMKQAA